MHISELQIGTETDELIARKLDFHHRLTPHFSFSWGAAWLIIDRMVAKGYCFQLEFSGDAWNCNFDLFPVDPLPTSQEAQTPALAICKAALQALA